MGRGLLYASMSNRQNHFSRAADSDTSNRMLEKWVQRELSRMHDQVLREPVPAELLALVAEYEDRKQEVLF